MPNVITHEWLVIANAAVGQARRVPLRFRVDLAVRSKVAWELGWRQVTELINEIHEGDLSLRRESIASILAVRQKQKRSKELLGRRPIKTGHERERWGHGSARHGLALVCGFGTPSLTAQGGQCLHP
jgi:hypothetical protein